MIALDLPCVFVPDERAKIQTITPASQNTPRISMVISPTIILIIPYICPQHRRERLGEKKAAQIPRDGELFGNPATSIL